jgi:tetratricopeptide (TPR) repeat protein
MAYLLLDDLETAEQYFDKANEIKPYEGLEIVGRTLLYFAEQRYDHLRDGLSNLMAFKPDDPHPFLLNWLGMVEIMEGNLPEARQHLAKAVKFRKGRQSPYSGLQDSQVKLAYVLWQLGEIDAANDLLDEASNVLEDAIKNGKDVIFGFHVLAQAECIRGNRSEALRWLQKAFDSGFVVIRVVEIDPLLADLHDDPQFKEMTADFKARIASMRERVEKNDR